MDIVTLQMAKKYAEETAIGAGGLKGDKGDRGPKGDTGATGPKGDKGDKGNDGLNGERGLRGEKGDTGDRGQKGDNGTNGVTPHIDATTGRWFIDTTDTGINAKVPTEYDWANIKNAPNIPTQLSDLSNDENFIKNTVDNLVNYYTKNNVYTKDEIINLISNVGNLTIEIVESLPTQDISSQKIYLMRVGESSVYTQHIYINNEWADLGNTSIDLSDYVTKSYLENTLVNKSNTDHTHTELHTHDNKGLLDTITAELITKWNTKFSGDYNDLGNKPTIPISLSQLNNDLDFMTSEQVEDALENKVSKIEGKSLSTNDLTDSLKAEYDEAVEKTHEHDNKATLDKLSESASGKPLYNGNPIGDSADIITTVIDENSVYTEVPAAKTVADAIIPIGFTYTQLPNQLAPWELWSFIPQNKWTNISTQYADSFFRVEGSKAQSFNNQTQAQTAQLPNITGVLEEYGNRTGYGGSSGAFSMVEEQEYIPVMGEKKPPYKSYRITTFNASSSNSTYVDGGEVRPQNYTIKIWKRTK